MGMDFRNQVWKRVWKTTLFILKQGKHLENQGAQPHQKIPKSTPFRGSGAGRKSCHHNHHVEYNVGLDDSFRLLFTYRWVIPSP